MHPFVDTLTLAKDLKIDHSKILEDVKDLFTGLYKNEASKILKESSTVDGFGNPLLNLNLNQLLIFISADDYSQYKNIVLEKHVYPRVRSLRGIDSNENEKTLFGLKEIGDTVFPEIKNEEILKGLFEYYKIEGENGRYLITKALELRVLMIKDLNLLSVSKNGKSRTFIHPAFRNFEIKIKVKKLQTNNEDLTWLSK